MRAIIRYYRKNGRPKGCVVAIDAGKVGWSFCHNGDVFSKKMAREIAFGRAFKPRFANMEFADKHIQTGVPVELQELYTYIEELSHTVFGGKDERP